VEVIPARIAGRYEVGALLGAGGSGRVHRARDLRLERDVALKLVPAEAARSADPAARERFASEARSAARAIHPNAVAIYDAGESDGHLYLVMELVDGPSLATVLGREGPLPVERAVRVVDDVLAALEAAHAAGIVHRDVKPPNVLLAPGGTAKLTDFGIAKRLDEVAASLTATGFVVGTPRYLAPEQLTGGVATPATDVYASGVLLHEALTGRPPFDGATPIALALAQRAGPPPDVRALRPEVPEAVAAVATRALRADPAERYPSAAAMRAGLAAATGSVAAGVPTLVAPRAAAPPTARLPQAPAPGAAAAGAPGPASSPRRGRGWLVPALFVGVLAAGLVGVSLADDGGRRGGPATTAGAAVPASVLAPQPAAATELPGTEPSVTEAPVSDPTDTEPAVTEPPATEPPVTEPPAPALEPPATPAPGTSPPATASPVPGPGDVGALVELVRAAPEAFGARGGELVDGLVEVAERKGRRQRDAARDVVERAREWAEEGEFGAEQLRLVEVVVAPLAGGGGGEDDDG